MSMPSLRSTIAHANGTTNVMLGSTASQSRTSPCLYARRSDASANTQAYHPAIPRPSGCPRSGPGNQYSASCSSCSREFRRTIREHPSYGENNQARGKCFPLAWSLPNKSQLESIPSCVRNNSLLTTATLVLFL